MIVTEIHTDDRMEPVWDSVGIRGCDFRSHINGHLYNVFTAIYPLATKADTEREFKNITLWIAEWVLINRSRFSAGDEFQIIVGWPREVRPDGRQCIKTGGRFDDLERLMNDPTQITIRDGWDQDIFDDEITE